MYPPKHPNCRCTYVLAELNEAPEPANRVVAGFDFGAGATLGVILVLLALAVAGGLAAIGVGGYLKYQEALHKTEMRK